MWPAGLSAHDALLTSASGPDSLHLQKKPVTSLVWVDGSVPESVGIEGNVVRQVTQTWVVDDSNVGVDGNNGALEASALESSLSLLDVGFDLRNISRARVDQLVTHRDGVDVIPRTVAGDSVADLGNCGRDLVNVVDAQEQLLVVSLGLQDVFDLVAVDTVQSDELVASQLLKVTLDLGERLAGTGGSVRRVGDTLGSTVEAAVRAGGWGGSGRGGGGRVGGGFSGRWGVGGGLCWSNLKAVVVGRDRNGSWVGVDVFNSTGLGTSIDDDGLGDNHNVSLLMLVVEVADWLGQASGGQSGQGKSLDDRVS
ncbi:hypothetical protein OGATHE_000481 [Ogataea polymorpha]|uniref:Uncharacterized protein n=1 Tax=Ogataea polymorpha TaxID=460523 RepID=A0A9P8PTG7_9ASCO|nr:hypothetical protein OGATHE_000481 [Ogataea polymorpha]